MVNKNISIITPVKNEIDNLPSLIESVEAQSLKPHNWVIVNDGSTDGSEDYIRDASDRISYLNDFHRNSEQKYDIGRHYAQVLSDGYHYILDESDSIADYYMILDGDMTLTKNYLECLVEYLEKEQSIAIASGGIYIEKGGKLELEERLKNHPAGGATLYRGPFYRDLGGPPITPCVDSVTKTKARLRGFECRYLPELDIKAIQARPTGQKGSAFQNQFQRGRDEYILNHHPLSIGAKTVQRMLTPPHYHSLGYCSGYVYSYLNGISQIDDAELREYYWRERPREIFQVALDKVPGL